MDKGQTFSSALSPSLSDAKARRSAYKTEKDLRQRRPRERGEEVEQERFLLARRVV